MLESKVVNYREVDYGDFNNWVMEYFKVPEYNIVECEKLNNDSSKTYNIDSSLGGYEARCVLEFIASKGRKQYVTYALMQYACNKGEIPPGKYVIHICW